MLSDVVEKPRVNGISEVEDRPSASRTPVGAGCWLLATNTRVFGFAPIPELPEAAYQLWRIPPPSVFLSFCLSVYPLMIHGPTDPRIRHPVSSYPDQPALPSLVG